MRQLNFTLINPNPIEYRYSPRSVAVGDFNNDTLLDIVVSNLKTNNIGILINQALIRTFHDESAPTLTNGIAGEEVKILTQINNWALIQSASGKMGWITLDQIMLPNQLKMTTDQND